MADSKVALNALDDLRTIALRNGNDQIATLCLAAKAMYSKLAESETRNCELSTVMVQLSSLLLVPNKRKVNKEDLLQIVCNARDMISEALSSKGEVEHA